MPKVSGQKLRILYLLKILWEKTDDEHSLTTAELMRSLKSYGVDAERKTLYDDIEQLRRFGIDIRTTRGREGGHSLVSREFELSELVLLADAVQSSRFITERKSAALIKKLSSLLSIYEAKRLSRQVHVSGRIKSMEETIFYNVDAIHTAIGEDRQISFSYFEWNEKKEKVRRHGGKRYRVSPYALCWDNENYYLVAHDSETNTIRHYRVDKMQKIETAEEKRGGKELASGFDIGKYTGELFGMFSGEECLVTLRCLNSSAGIIIDRFGRDIPFRKSGENHFELTVKVMLSPHFYTWVMNFGDSVVITAPERAVEGLKDTARKALAAYGTEEKL